MAHDQALLRNAKADLERYKTLFEQDSIAKQQLDTQASLVGQYESTLKVDQATIDNARLQLTYSRVTAPISGRLGLRQVDAGNIVHASDTNGIVVITQLQPITVVFTLPEDNISAVMKKVHAGEKLTVDAFDRAGKLKIGTGTLLTVDNQIDTTTGTIKLKAQFTNDDMSLFPNQFVNARMLLDIKHDAVLIPSAAILRGTQGLFVYVVKEDKSVTVRPVKVGTVEGELSSIDSGLAVGEVVVTDGTDKLREGAKIETSTREAAAGAADGAQGKKHRDGDTPPASGS
jgi:multidrug efflux system membrane fusion protein